MSDLRIEHEIAHGKHLAEVGRGTLWYWETPAGKFRFPRRVKMLTTDIREGMDVLELGCGPGYLTRHLATTGAKIRAIDISSDLLEFARRAVTSPHVTFGVENAYGLSYPAASFDIVVGSSVLHHLEWEQALKEFFRVLRPGGKICFTEPNMLNPQIFLERKVPLLRRLTMTSPDETAFVRWQLAGRLAKNGFSDIQIIPFDFLHPLLPAGLVRLAAAVGMWLERIPLIKEIAGLLYIRAQKPATS